MAINATSVWIPPQSASAWQRGAVIDILIIIGAYFTQASIIFHTGGLTARPPEAFPIGPVTFVTADGLRLNGWWLAACPAANRT